MKIASDATAWGIHAGEVGQADTLFLQQGYIAIGWHQMGDLSAIPNDQEAFKAKVKLAYPGDKPGAIPNFAGQLRRFTYEIKPGDLVIYPSKQDRQIHLGRVAGPYLYGPQMHAQYPHLHKVEWLKLVPRTHFSQGALYEIGSAMSLFQVKNFVDEFRAVLDQPAPVVSAVPDTEDETVALVAEDIEQTTRDFILKRLVTQFKGHPFAHLVAHLLGTMGYRTRVSPPGPDTGVDIVAYKDELGFLPPIIKVQVKSSEGNIGNHDVAALYGTLASNEFGLFVTLAAFTNPAKTFASGKNNLRLIDGNELVELVLEHYEEFDASYKVMIPLKRIFVPVSTQSEE